MSKPKAVTFAELARAGALYHPDAIAIVDGSLTLRYAELARAVQQLAAAFLQRGVRAGDRVMLIGPHSATQVAAILAVSALGGVFVPVDPVQPVARMQWLRADARPKLVLATRSIGRALGIATDDTFLDWSALDLCLLASASATYAPSVLPQARVAPSDLAYIMYTSGSTGHPKGVQIAHGALQRFFESYNASLQIGLGDRCLNTGRLHFDVSLLDVFLPLYFGATVVLSSYLPVPSLLLHELERHRITHLYAVGTLLAQITGDGSALERIDLRHLKLLQTGAEVCKPAVVNQWLSRWPELRFCNSYGPTEVAVGCIQYLKPEPGPLSGSECPIGVPHAGTQVLLVDGRGQLVTSPGIAGELLIGGAQLMRGYWDKPDLTARAFTEIAGVRYYRSGDIARRDALGRYWFVGRNDEQIKHSGYRIDLSELRCALGQHPNVLSAASGVVRDHRGQDQLAVIGLVSAPPSAALVRSLLACMRESLPGYMVPGVLGLLRSWPRMPSGKADLPRCLAELARAAARMGRGSYVRTARGFEFYDPTGAPELAASHAPS
jgi:D-alanine--poly(phosphoribitol) ligase subunit 1